jgi:nucleoid DNA-binding protein
MKKALLMATSGVITALISFNAFALNQGEAEDKYIEINGGTKAAANTKFNAWEKLLKDELASKRAVKIDGLGTYAPKELSGTRQVNGFGGIKTVESYKLIKKPETTDTAAFIDKYAAATGMSKEEASAFNEQYIGQIKSTLRKGGSVQISGLGSYKVGKRPTTSYVNSKGETIVKRAYKDPRFTMEKGAVRQKFTEDESLRSAVN